jgi:hypothetical protein
MKKYCQTQGYEEKQCNDSEQRQVVKVFRFYREGRCSEHYQDERVHRKKPEIAKGRACLFINP